MIITSSELENYVSKYLDLSLTEDVYIMRNGKVISMLSNPGAKKSETLKALEGLIAAPCGDVNMKDESLKRQ